MRILGGYRPTREDARWFAWLLWHRIVPGFICDWLRP